MSEIFRAAYSIILWSCRILEDTWVFGETGSMAFASDEVDDRNSLCIHVVFPSVSASLTVRSDFRTDNFLKLDTVFLICLWILFCKPEI